MATEWKRPTLMEAAEALAKEKGHVSLLDPMMLREAIASTAIEMEDDDA